MAFGFSFNSFCSSIKCKVLYSPSLIKGTCKVTISQAKASSKVALQVLSPVLKRGGSFFTMVKPSAFALL